jgi:hypothetical protein
MIPLAGEFLRTDEDESGAPLIYSGFKSGQKSLKYIAKKKFDKAIEPLYKSIAFFTGTPQAS